jgi:hypothetical protein
MTDWLNASKEECAELYRRVKRFIDERNLRSDRLLEEIYAGTSAVGSDDFNNLRKGSLGRKKVNLIGRWFEEHQPGVLTAQIPNVQPKPFEAPFLPKREATPIRWMPFLEKHALSGKVDVRLMVPRAELSAPPEKPLVERKPKPSPFGDIDAMPSVGPPDQWPASKTTVRLGEEFYFAFTPEIPGPILALQRNGYPWWEPLPISGHEAYLETAERFMVLPHDGDGNALPLLENDRAGPHDFVFVQAPMTLLSPTIEAVGGSWQVGASELDDLARRLDQAEGHWTIMRLRVMFRA